MVGQVTFRVCLVGVQKKKLRNQLAPGEETKGSHIDIYIFKK